VGVERINNSRSFSNCHARVYAVIRKYLYCDTFRAIDYFTESIRIAPYLTLNTGMDPPERVPDTTCEFRAVSCPSWNSFDRTGTCGVLCTGRADQAIPADPPLTTAATPVGRTTASCVRMGMNAEYDYRYLTTVQLVNFDNGIRYYSKTGGETAFCREFTQPDFERPSSQVLIP
jgi:hypothetical protein